MTRSAGNRDKAVLELCVTVEFACAELYHYFAEIFKDDRKDLHLWLKAAMEEENHARLFQLVQKMGNDHIIESIMVELVEIEVTLEFVQTLTAAVKKSPPTMEEALRSASELETRLEAFMIGNVIEFSDKSYEKLFLAIANYNEHIQDIQQAYGRISAARLAGENCGRLA